MPTFTFQSFAIYVAPTYLPTNCVVTVSQWMPADWRHGTTDRRPNRHRRLMLKWSFPAEHLSHTTPHRRGRTLTCVRWRVALLLYRQGHIIFQSWWIWRTWNSQLELMRTFTRSVRPNFVLPFVCSRECSTFKIHVLSCQMPFTRRLKWPISNFVDFWTLWDLVLNWVSYGR